MIVEIKLLVFLRYLSTGSFMEVCGDLLNISKASAFNYIHEMIAILCGMKDQLIKFPDPGRFSNIETLFRSKRGFPGVIGCLDGSQIEIWVRHSQNRETFRNCKGFLSLNIQAVCGPDCEIYDLVTEWPGSAHDSRVFNQSQICARLNNGEFGEFHLLADSAYTLTNHVLTPYKKDDTNEKSNEPYICASISRDITISKLSLHHFPLTLLIFSKIVLCLSI